MSFVAEHNVSFKSWNQAVEKIPLKSFLSFSRNQSHFCLLDSNQYFSEDKSGLNKYKMLAAWGCLDEIKPHRNALHEMDRFVKKNASRWIFGFITYELKNEIENLQSLNEDNIKAPILHFFVPEFVYVEDGISSNIICQSSKVLDAGAVLSAIYNSEWKKTTFKSKLNLSGRISKADYITQFEKIKKHIQRGDVYELNYCQEFFAENVSVQPEILYFNLNRISPSPMSCFYKSDDLFLMSSSPERFLAKRGDKIYSQPMKGTMPRGSDANHDLMLSKKLFHDEKERSENVMIVDLVRNDLSRIAQRGTVCVEELFGVYSYSHVHQMVSTVSCRLKENTGFAEILKATFPMGSMTGAPKIRAMQLIEDFETARRGLYSGSVGYISPCGNFDFNVVIRSLIFNHHEKYLSAMTGSAITAKSDAETEYNECRLKAVAMEKALNLNA